MSIIKTPQVISDKLARRAKLVVGLLSLARHWFRAKDARGLYDNFASRYDDVFGDDKLAAEDIIKEHLHGGSEILDIACGTGLTTFPLLGKYKRVFGIDISRGMLGEAKNKAETKKVYFTQGSFISLPFRDASFDAAICVGAIWHLKEGEEKVFVEEIYRVLKPGGAFITTVQALRNAGSWGNLVNRIFSQRRFARDKIQFGKFTSEYILKMFSDDRFFTESGAAVLKKSSAKFNWPIVKVYRWSAR